ncbi:MAG: hypothetical protein A3F72_02975 [Bacteroidetes bacterium RIFCSPLOWO2_12_FULL_35_15]|nr:MAG: hypothetical protein A3F72_02975 [Bacteroidetes bacterium RIFCSPLOWO2_12_FULL_35_15]
MNTEVQNQVEQYAGLFFSPKEIAIILELEEKSIDNKDFKIHYQRGRLKQEALVRRSVFELAINGSSPAQISALQIIENTKLHGISV